MSLCRLIYKSISNITATEDAVLKKLQHQAAFKNKEFDICGILFSSDSKFLQILEGNPKHIRRLYSNIMKDKRHHAVELITYTDITKTEYSDWSMKLVDLNNLGSKYRKLLEQTTQTMFAQKYEDVIKAHRSIREIIKQMQTGMESNISE